MHYYLPGKRGTCPHCSVAVVFEQRSAPQYKDADGVFQTVVVICPSCTKAIISRINLTADNSRETQTYTYAEQHLLWPTRKPPRPVPTEVPADIANDYAEAALVIESSPKASAALSRRCLQAVLRDAGQANQRDLVQQIDAVLPSLPSYIAQNVDAIRNIGNFAAHPSKDKSSGEIVDVEVGEAEWNLDVLDELFDFYYLQPALAQKRRNELNAKLTAAGKAPMK